MKINIGYTSTKWYDRSNISQWVWMFEPYRYIRGFKMRIFGVYINTRESNAFSKLMGMAHGKGRQEDK